MTVDGLPQVIGFFTLTGSFSQWKTGTKTLIGTSSLYRVPNTALSLGQESAACVGMILLIVLFGNRLTLSGLFYNIRSSEYG